MPADNNKKKKGGAASGARRRASGADEGVVRRLARGQTLTPAERRRRLVIARTVGSDKQPEPDESNGTC